MSPDNSVVVVSPVGGFETYVVGCDVLGGNGVGRWSPLEGDRWPVRVERDRQVTNWTWFHSF